MQLFVKIQIGFDFGYLREQRKCRANGNGSVSEKHFSGRLTIEKQVLLYLQLQALLLDILLVRH